MWSEFIGCTKSFAASCISSSDLSQFNRAVGNSINSVHKMCTNEDYQKGMTFVKWEMQFIRNQACMPNMWRMWRKTRCANWFWQILNPYLSSIFFYRLLEKCELHQKRCHWRNGLQNVLRRITEWNHQSFGICHTLLVILYFLLWLENRTNCAFWLFQRAQRL